MRIAAKEAAPGLAALALVAATVAALSGERTIYGDPTGDVPLEMPAELGPWTGETVWFCQNDQCARSFPESELAARAAKASRDEAAPDAAAEASPAEASPAEASPAEAAPDAAARKCPECGGALSVVSLGENKLLPEETPIFRRVYHRTGHPDVLATVVFSGMERRSIHRPQVCLVSQGNRILDEFTASFAAGPADAGGRVPKMPLRVLQIAFPLKDPATGKTVSQAPSVYAYWLFNPEYETVQHLARFARMLLDNCFRSYRPRWGYASISIAVDPDDPDAWREELDGFLPHFRPVIDGVRARLAARRNVPLHLTGTSASANEYRGTNTTTTAMPRR